MSWIRNGVLNTSPAIYSQYQTRGWISVVFHGIVRVVVSLSPLISYKELSPEATLLNITATSHEVHCISNHFTECSANCLSWQYKNTLLALLALCVESSRVVFSSANVCSDHHIEIWMRPTEFHRFVLRRIWFPLTFLRQWSPICQNFDRSTGAHEQGSLSFTWINFNPSKDK